MSRCQVLQSFFNCTFPLISQTERESLMNASDLWIRLQSTSLNHRQAILSVINKHGLMIYSFKDTFINTLTGHFIRYTLLLLKFLIA